MKEEEEIKLFKQVIRILKRGYGGDCETSDIDDFPEFAKEGAKYVESSKRCGSCRAKETMLFLKDHIELLKM